jgi:glutathione S-transferase
MELCRYVDLDTARQARGLRLLAAASLPSPFTEAAKGLFHFKGLPLLAVRFKPRDPEQAAWSGTHNAPAVFFDDEPPRTGWAEIIVLAERLGGPPLLPAATSERARLFGLVHELVGEGGLAWCSRLIMIDGGLTTEGKRGFPLQASRYLAPKYGHTVGCAPAARAKLLALLGFFERLIAEARAAGRRYLLGDAPSALDIYLATSLTPLAGITAADCPGMRPEILPAFQHLIDEVGPLPELLREHRALVFERHLVWPIAL